MTKCDICGKPIEVEATCRQCMSQIIDKLDNNFDYEGFNMWYEDNVSSSFIIEEIRRKNESRQEFLDT
jgi:hypothetical protein